MRRQAPGVPIYGEHNNFGAQIPRSSVPTATVGGYTQYGGTGSRRPSRVSTTQQPIILVDGQGTPIPVECCVGGFSLLNISKVVIAEALGTIILMYVGCAGPSIKAISFGVAIVAATQIFGGISGAHINPAVTVASLVMGKTSIMLAPVYIMAQGVGAILGYLLHDELNSLESKCNILQESKDSKYSTNYLDGSNLEAQLFGLEFIMTAIYIAAVCSLWHRAEKNGGDSAVPLKRGLLYMFIVMANPVLTSLNPLRASIPLIWISVFNIKKYLWIYWIAPLLGALLGSCLYRLIAELHKKQDNNSR